MKLTRFQPYNRLAQASDFDQWMRHPFSALTAFESLFGNPATAATGTTLGVDVYEDGENYFARFEVPGVKREDAKIELHEGLLTVSVQKARKETVPEESFRMTRSISVPDTLKAEAITAKLEDGVLTVTLPKPEERKPRTIELS